MIPVTRYVVHAREFSIWDITFRLSSPGGGTQQSFIRKALPRGSTFYPLYTIFDRKVIPFAYLLLTNEAF